MSRLYRKFIPILAALLMFSGSTAYAGDTLNLTLDEAIELAIENNNNLNIMKLSERQVLDGVKMAKNGASTSEYIMNQYYDYIQMYEIGGTHIQKYKTMDMDEAMTAYRAALTAVMTNPMMSKDSYDKLQEEIKYGEYIMMFGIDEPKLEDEDKYKKFIKNIELTVLNAEGSKDKYYSNIEMIKSSLEGGIAKLYLSYNDFNQNMTLQKSLMDYNLRSYEDSKSRYDKGLISYNDYLKAKDTYETQQKRYEILQLQYENLKLTINSQLGVSMDTNVRLSGLTPKQDTYSLVNYDSYVDMALSSSDELKNATYDLNYKKKEIGLYDKYINTISREKQQMDSDLKVYEYTVKNLEESIKSNVRTALEDLMEKQAKVEEATIEFEIAKTKYNQSKKQLELGLINNSIALAMESSYIGSAISREVAIRDLANSNIKFELLINKGIKY